LTINSALYLEPALLLAAVVEPCLVLCRAHACSKLCACMQQAKPCSHTLSTPIPPHRRSTQGGYYIPRTWCEKKQLPNAHSTTLVFVGDNPWFDSCMENICVDKKPQEYMFTWIPHFSIHEQMRKSGAAATAVMNQFESYELDVKPLNEAVMVKTVQAAMAALPQAIAELNRGWILGDGGDNDPCVDRARRRNAGILYGTFGMLLLVIVADGVLQANKKSESLLVPGSASGLGCLPCMLSCDRSTIYLCGIPCYEAFVVWECTIVPCYAIQ
jgi:hypothetical protein